MAQPFPPGARLLARPASATPCPTCGNPTGRGYPDCTACAAEVDAYWLADWGALLSGSGVAEGTQEEKDLAAQVLTAPPGHHPWTCDDWAMRRTPCPECRAELGSGALDCLSCASADQSRWAWPHLAPTDRMHPNEKALRQAVTRLRSAERGRPGVVSFCKLVLPFLLTGETPTRVQARRIRMHLMAGREDELSEATSIAHMASLPTLPWRS
ncbi:hypothetical protein [Actinokineospora bangkokensis]|uniref:Uncharacterized protein n=1 Tax=Actinokineospora bangkokensis TaxID=1193682 RepID=A0A1Q9LCR6_9PSEU|nr:hypothetical protein [Actinokineospora bangkokensis]OLR89827.1 hypothetical protein BJP25_02040 [Actinokineospora bangkokensis]